MARGPRSIGEYRSGVSRQPLGVVVQAACGLPLLVGAAMCTVFNEFTGIDLAALVARIYLVTAPGTALLVVGMALLAWQRRRWPFDGDAACSEWARLTWAALAGIGIGCYAGFLSEVTLLSGEPAPAIAYFIYLPLVLLSCTGAPRAFLSARRVVVVMLCVEAGAQGGIAYATSGRTVMWGEVTTMNLVYLVLALAAVAAAAWLRGWWSDTTTRLRRPVATLASDRNPRPATN